MSTMQFRHAQASLTGHAGPEPLILQPPARCDSCDQESWEDEILSPAETRPLSLNRKSFGDLATASRQQLQWDKAMCSELKLAQGYAKFCVLLIRWEKCDWPENTEKEINDLNNLFSNTFGYTVEVLSLRAGCTCGSLLPCGCSAQNRLDRRVTSFFQKYGGVGNEDNLIILYHTGHGWYDQELQHLELQGMEQKDGQPPPPKVIWNHTEQKFIELAHCDILVIMDSCMAGGVSSIIQGEAGRTYEYLAPSKPYQPTNAPGDKSFTRALINSLEQLLKEKQGQPFTTLDLHTVLSQQKTRKGKGYGFLVPRSKYNSRRIELRPMLQDADYFDNSKVHSYLNLRIELKQGELNEDELKDLAKLVSRAVRESKAQTRRVDLLSLEARPPLSLKNAVKQTMSMRQGILAMGKKSLLHPVAEEGAGAPSLRKPGIYAAFGWMSSRLHPYTLTIVLERPWSLLFVGCVATMLLTRAVKRPGNFRTLLTAGGKWFGQQTNLT